MNHETRHSQPNGVCGEQLEYKLLTITSNGIISASTVIYGIAIFLWLPYVYIFKTGPPVFANRCISGKQNHQPFSLDRFASL